MAGFAYAGYNDVIAPDLGNFEFGTELVIWVALGGRGTLLGPAIAAVLIDATSAYLSGTLPFIWQLIVGLVFIVVIVLAPQGLGPALLRLVRFGRARVETSPGIVQTPDPDVGSAGGGAAIAVEAVARRYGSLHVLEDISFSARAGELVSLVGPNGAGKTTLIRCISDGLERTAGRVRIGGVEIGRRSPEACVRLGLGRKFQTPNVFDTLSVAQSLRIARAGHERLSPLRRADTVRLPAAAMRVVTATGLDSQLGTTVKHLSHGAKQALELAMVLAMEPRVLLLDEPTAGLTKAERTLIGAILVTLVRDHGLCILLVEHDLEFVREISSRIVVLHQGRIVLDGTVAEVTGVRAGPHHLHGGAARRAGSGMNALEVSGLVAGYGEAMVLRDVSLHVAPGEVLAVLGKNGMGKSTLLKTIMGFLPARAGTISLFAEQTNGTPPHRLRRPRPCLQPAGPGDLPGPDGGGEPSARPPAWHGIRRGVGADRRVLPVPGQAAAAAGGDAVRRRAEDADHRPCLAGPSPLDADRRDHRRAAAFRDPAPGRRVAGGAAVGGCGDRAGGAERAVRAVAGRSLRRAGPRRDRGPG